MKGINLNLSKQKAISLYESKEWEKWSNLEIVAKQLYTEKLFLPFEIFHEAIEIVLNRPVYTHEFAQPESLKKEFEKITWQSPNRMI